MLTMIYVDNEENDLPESLLQTWNSMGGKLGLICRRQRCKMYKTLCHCLLFIPRVDLQGDELQNVQNYTNSKVSLNNPKN